MGLDLEKEGFGQSSGGNSCGMERLNQSEACSTWAGVVWVEEAISDKSARRNPSSSRFPIISAAAEWMAGSTWVRVSWEVRWSVRDSGRTRDSRRACRGSSRGRSMRVEETGQSESRLEKFESSSSSKGASTDSVGRSSSSRTGLVWSSVCRRFCSSRAGVCRSWRDCWIWGEIETVCRRLGWRDKDMGGYLDWAFCEKRQKVIWPK